jgi:phage shock protein A
MTRLREAEQRLTNAVAECEKRLAGARQLEARALKARAAMEELDGQVDSAIRQLRDLIRKREPGSGKGEADG